VRHNELVEIRNIISIFLEALKQEIHRLYSNKLDKLITALVEFGITQNV